jgi:hypothetical protein
MWLLHLTRILPLPPGNISMNWNNMLVVSHSYKKFQIRKKPEERIKLYFLFINKHKRRQFNPNPQSNKPLVF